MATIKDIVLVHVDNQPGFFARIEDIIPDVKAGWWQVRLLVLTLPLQVYTWILDESQINGTPFTMGGTPMVLEVVTAPKVKESKQPFPSARQDKEPASDNDSSHPSNSTKVVFLSDRKKKE